MLFAIIYRDKPDHEPLRIETRPAHIDFLKNCGHHVHMAGPLLNETGETMTGSILIMDFPDWNAAKDYCANDPYTKAGLFSGVEISRWKQTLPTLKE